MKDIYSYTKSFTKPVKVTNILSMSKVIGTFKFSKEQSWSMYHICSSSLCHHVLPLRIQSHIKHTLWYLLQSFFVFSCQLLVLSLIYKQVLTGILSLYPSLPLFTISRTITWSCSTSVANRCNTVDCLPRWLSETSQLGIGVKIKCLHCLLTNCTVHVLCATRCGTLIAAEATRFIFIPVAIPDVTFNHLTIVA